MRCDQCEVLVVSGVRCHEQGCPDAWKDETRECKECGTKFKPTTRWDRHCSPCCWAVYTGSECQCDGCRDDREDARQAGAAFDEWHGVLCDD